MKLKEALEDKKLDIRLRDKLLSDGKISGKEIKDNNAKLEDLSDKCESAE